MLRQHAGRGMLGRPRAGHAEQVLGFSTAGCAAHDETVLASHLAP